MAKRRITGSFVALITPMNADYSVDFEGFGTLIDFQVEHGTSALLMMGSSGEVSVLSPEERHAIVSETMKRKRAGVEMWYGCTGPTTEATIAFVSQAASEGAAGAVIAAPSYICASRSDIVQFFIDVADSSSIPIGIYNNPPRVGTDLLPEDVLRIAEHPNVLVLKESTSRVGQIAAVAAAKADISLMCCCNPNLGLVVQTMALGGHGTANVTGNMIPREMVTISTPWESSDDSQRFKEEYLRNLPMLEFAYSAVNPVPTKSFLGAVGMPAGPMRRPLTTMSGSDLQQGLMAAKQLELDKIYGYSL